MNINYELYFSIIGAVTGIVGMIIAILGVFHNRFLAIHQYMTALEDPKFIEARTRIYNLQQGQSIPIDDKDAALIVNFFHHWGLLVKKKYLPKWVFDSGSGAGVIRLYELTQDYILERRSKHRDGTYASNFEWLYHEIKRRKVNKKW